MGHYDYAKVYGDTHGVLLVITDQQEAEVLISSLKGFFPSLQVERLRLLPSGDTYQFKLHKLSNRDADATWWLIKQFCERGWEPLGPLCIVGGTITKDGGSISTAFEYQFRRSV